MSGANIPSPEALGRVLADKLLARLGPGPAEDQALQAFAAQAAEDVVPAELPEFDLDDLAANLAAFWTFAEKRRGLSPVLRVARAERASEDSPRLDLDRVEIVQEDAPFLVDSVMGEIAEQGFQVRAMFHPVVQVARDAKGLRAAEGALRRESMIQVFIDRIGPDREEQLLSGLRTALADARAAVADFPAMLDLMGRTVAELESLAPVTPRRAEELAFLRWLHTEHFVFLGARIYEYPRAEGGEYASEEPLFQPQDGLGVLRDPAQRVLRRTNEPAVLTAQLARRLEDDSAVTVAKANMRSRVHRRGYMDYVGVRRYGPDGRPSGEVRFVGLFTAEAYDQPVAAVPLVRAKAAGALARAAKAPGSHNAKRLKNIVENYPRDELFQMTEDELLTNALGVLHLHDRPRVRLFERRDPFDRFCSILMFVPRERYDSDLRIRAGQLLAKAYGGRVSAYYPSFSDSPLARVHFIIGFSAGQKREPDLAAVEGEIAEAARTWEDRFEAAVRDLERPAAVTGDLLGRYYGAFSAGYRDRYDAAEALADVAVIDDLSPGEIVRVRAFRREGDTARNFRFKLYRPAEPAPLADVLPILESMGLKAMAEAGFPVRRVGADPVWVHEFELDDPRGENLVFDDVKACFEQAFVAVWTGQTENDGFNRLVLELSIGWREAALVRALARYRQQTGLDPSQRLQEEALSRRPGVTRLILDLFRTRFDPAVRADLAERQAQAGAVMGEITEALQMVESLDDDRVLRRIALLVQSILRTNYYQIGDDGAPAPFISFKVASEELADLPAPKPYREIYVWSTSVEGVHLRFGPVARGGLRWSDRRDDFRTEVLGLAKAQQVKNAVIVPVGAKGGFYPKALPVGGSPDAVRAAGVEAYKTFLRGLLDITDNLTPEGQVIAPKGVVAHDGEDPYLVVAADKGTATFSDIANGLAESYGFWLGDAFASGGSAGYDHKEMGITARGAWEAVKRHFRELGKDIQAEPFTVVGVGDMSGDVFGNGMLLSRQIRLLAGFDHRHIFLDPDPDPATSFAERERLFALPRSSWDDYDRDKISAGGGVFPRSQKSIPLSAEIQAMLEVEADTLTPVELISAILKAKAELLYLGGIGTYVKAAAESHADVGDKANDALRVNAQNLRVRVVGEGANLGLTQAARIAFAEAGGRVNSDAIDNSAGVDSSDHEVNIKILTGMVERAGDLTRPDRDKLLRSMIDDVAEHVLAHNYDQNQALSLLELDAVGELEPHARFMARLESIGRLDRVVEGLPDAAAIAARAEAGLGLTRPELAVLMAYGKIQLFREMVETEVPDDPWFEQVLEGYFPAPLMRYAPEMRRHRLRREIIATVVANDVVNRCGPSFPGRLMAAAGCDARAFFVGYEAARAVLDVAPLWEAVEALDNEVPARAQLLLLRQLARQLRGLTFWFARRAQRQGEGVSALIDRYAKPARALKALAPEVLTPVERADLDALAERLTAAGAPEALAHAVVELQPLTIAADLADLAEASRWPVEHVARLHHKVGEVFGFDRLRAAAGGHSAGDIFERTAVRRLVEDLLSEQTAVARAVMGKARGATAGADARSAEAAIKAWSASVRDAVASANRTLAEIESAPGGWTFAKLTIAHGALRELAVRAEG
ncbi:NAD-glutamate dehydrogenase [Phenylobacterium sp.]|uniref:NAD-glutamate dehydrogenase n=1 Tax=Phenylobacterium sp. TaxID=1871053 RepID=UPI0027304FF9|nr:NAD-glutamate dehydrogenase [Phenylobacterium sp.]MDP1872865.1 NAD-glutamate dehydrogenase [Phenylobacterium sp.]